MSHIARMRSRQKVSARIREKAALAAYIDLLARMYPPMPTWTVAVVIGAPFIAVLAVLLSVWMRGLG